MRSPASSGWAPAPSPANQRARATVPEDARRVTAVRAPATRPPAGLHFGLDDEPGIRRTGHRRPCYRDELTGDVIDDPELLERIRALAVPPAWTDVWISADPCSHVQATGRDARGRKQYRYHPGFRQHQEEAKFELLVPFGHALPALRRRVERDLRRAGLPRDRRGRRHRRAARANPRPGRQRGVRPGQRLVRAHDAARPPREDRRRPPAAALHRQERQGARGRPRRPSSGAAGAALPGAPRPAAVPVRRRRRRAAPRPLVRRERLPARRHRHRRHREDVPHLERQPVRGGGPRCATGARDRARAGEVSSPPW